MSTVRLTNVVAKSLMLLFLAGSCCLAAGSLRPEGPREKRSFALPTRLKYEHATQRMALAGRTTSVNTSLNGQRGFRGSALPTRIKYQRASNSSMTQGASSSSFASSSTQTEDCTSGCGGQRKGRRSSGQTTRTGNTGRRNGRTTSTNKRQGSSRRSDYIMHSGLPVLVP